MTPASIEYVGSWKEKLKKGKKEHERGILDVKNKSSAWDAGVTVHSYEEARSDEF
jgi:hypothetical protein